MNEPSQAEPRFDERPEAVTRQVAAADWNRADIEAVAQATPRRERLFSRKVMIGWALFALAAYFGVQAGTAAVKASVRQAVRSGVLSSATQTKDRIVIVTPDGKRVTISRKPGPSVEVIRTEPPMPTTPRSTDPTTRTRAPQRTGPTTPATSAGAAAKAEEPAPAVSPEPKKR